MSRRVITRRRPARRDLQEHFEFLGERAGVETAERFLQAAEATFHELATMPEMGSPQPFLHPRFADIRRWRVRGFENYLIFYQEIPRSLLRGYLAKGRV